MKDQKINVSVENGVKELIIRHGEAEKLPAIRKPAVIEGTISVPRIHLENPSNWLTDKVENGDNVLAFSRIEINREKKSIEFIEDEGREWESHFLGVLEFTEIFEKFGINSDKSYTSLELGEFIKMNRSHFETRDKAMKLVNELRKFKAKVDKDIENADDGRGNRKILLAQAVDSNIPESFKITIPIFKGQPKQTLDVEISIDAGDLSCRLISPEANDYVEQMRDKLIDAEIEQIRELHPTLRIFEV
ncbi:hypothetical protein [Mesonia aquimarina]|uniref:hypothetical protein n=1 Tax=Mesonia aquimarina TaxID=1504967 RepID=UPI0013CE83A3|nr:hypothetical protein [Mesonia aquimarina]